MGDLRTDFEGPMLEHDSKGQLTSLIGKTDCESPMLEHDNKGQLMSRNGKTDFESPMLEHDDKDQFMSPNGKTDSESSMLEHDNKDQFMSPNGKTDSESLMFEHDNKGQIMSRIVGTVFHRYLLLQLLIFVMLLILNSMTGYYLNNEPETYQQDSTDLCLPCLDLKCHADESYEGIVKRDDGMCCARNGQNISTVISQYTTRWYKMKLEEEDPHFHYCQNNNEEQESHASLKLVGPYVEQGEDNTIMRLVSWNQTEPPGSEGNGLQYREGYIRIPETALYYVYTQLALKDRKTGSYDMLIFSHVVVQQSASSDDEESILNSANTPDPCEGEVSDQQSSYLGSYMMLKEGDKIAVKVGGGPDIIKDSEINFFGVYKA